jgi:hypothetical protein
MMIWGIEFPYDHNRSISGHGPIAGFILRTHPVAGGLAGGLTGIIIGCIIRWWP